MPDLSLPAPIVEALSALRKTDSAGFEAIMNATEMLCEPSGISSFAESVAASTPFEQRNAVTLIDMAMSIVRRSDTLGTDLDELIADLLSASELGLDEHEMKSLASLIKPIVSCHPLRVLAKSLSLLRAYDSLFLDAKIVTDIRPVFGEDVTEGPEAAVLAHLLDIDILRSGEKESIHMVLEHDDLLNIRNVIDRAIAKSTSLKETLKAAGISIPDL